MSPHMVSPLLLFYYQGGRGRIKEEKSQFLLLDLILQVYLIGASQIDTDVAYTPEATSRNPCDTGNATPEGNQAIPPKFCLASTGTTWMFSAWAILNICSGANLRFSFRKLWSEMSTRSP